MTTIQSITYTRKESEKRNLQQYVTDTPVTLKQSQDHRTWYNSVDFKQGYKYTQFERPSSHRVQEEASIKVL